MMYKKPKLGFRDPNFLDDSDGFAQRMQEPADPVKSGFLPEHLANLVYADKDPRLAPPMDMYSTLDEDEKAQRDNLLRERQGDSRGLGISNALSSWAGMPDNKSGEAVWDNRRSLRNEALKGFDTIAKDRRGLLDDFYKSKTGLAQSDAAKGDLGGVTGMQFDHDTTFPDAFKVAKSKFDMDKMAQDAELRRLMLEEKNKPKDPRESNRFLIETSKMNSDLEKINKDFSNSIDSARVLRGQLEMAKNPDPNLAGVAWKGIGKTMASFMGEGARTTDEDVKRYIEGLGVLNLVEQFNQFAGSKPTPERVAAVENIMNMIAKDLEQLRWNKTEGYVKGYQNTWKMTPEEADYYVNYSRFKPIVPEQSGSGGRRFTKNPPVGGGS